MPIDLKNLKKVYFLGVGGIGMSALAKLFVNAGKIVVGSDTGFADLERLKKSGIQIFEGYDETRIDNSFDAVIYTLATAENNPEFLRAKALGLPIFTYAEMLGLVSKDKNTIAICGTHGKTTTTAMISHIMIKCGLKPSVIVGSLMKYEHDGVVEKTNFIAGTSDYLVAESCEYKKSFLNICPKIVCITNIDADHLDFYGSIENIIKTFKEFVAKLPPDGIVIADLDDMNSQKVVEGCGKKVINSRDFFDEKVKLSVFGEHNRKNASVALALASIVGISNNNAKEALETFTGTWRRFEYKGRMQNGSLVYDDYGHHPHEILATLNGAREAFPAKKLSVVFEPHLYSRTKEHFREFAETLAKFDKVYLTDIYAAREKFDASISSGLLTDEISKINPNVFYIKNYADIASSIKKDSSADDVVITMGAGTIGELSEMLIS